MTQKPMGFEGETEKSNLIEISSVFSKREKKKKKKKTLRLRVLYVKFNTFS